MTVVTRKYNPGFLSDEELVSSFCVRLNLFRTMVESLSECTESANIHQIVIGPRGSGKTSLLLRVAAEVRRNDKFSSRFFPIVFAEESYEVSTAGEFWLECLSRLAEQMPIRPNSPDLKCSYEELRQIREDRMLGDRCLGVLQDFADREGKRLVLIVENLNMMFRDIVDKDTGWRLRHTLQTEPRIILLASATSRFDEIGNPDYAFYDLLRELTLRPLDPEECAVLWQNVSGRERPSETIRALRILTGGSPRLLTIVARFGANLSFRNLMTDLLDLIDEHTEYFKSHLDALPAQERRIYLALADLWIPATAREIANRARLDTSKCSAHLARLVDRGAVEVSGGSARRKQYYITERLYNIYYLMRRSRGSAPLVEALIQFMEAYYLPSELKDFIVRTIRDAIGFEDETKRMVQIAFDHLLESPVLSVRREAQSTLKPRFQRSARNNADVAKVLFNKALTIVGKGQELEEVALWNEVVQRLQASNGAEELEMVAAALVNKGTALDVLNRTDDALAAWDEVVHRFGPSESPEIACAVAKSLIKKAAALNKRDRLKEALDVCDEVLHRYEYTSAGPFSLEIATALRIRGSVLSGLNRLEEALVAWDDVIRHFDSAGSLMFCDEIAAILVRKGETLAQVSREEEAIEVWTDVVHRFGWSDAASIRYWIALSLIRRGNMLADLNRPQDALDVMDEVIYRFGSTDKEPALIYAVCIAILGKVMALISLNRLPEAVVACDEIVNDISVGTTSESEVSIGMVLFAKGKVLAELNHPGAALTFWDEVVQQFNASDEPILQNVVKSAQLEIAELHLAMGQGDASVIAVESLFEPDSPESPEIRCRGLLTRTRAHLLGGNKTTYMRDIETALSVLSGIDPLPTEVLNSLCGLAVELGPESLRELIIASPVSSQLLPLTTALEKEIGIESRVAREVEEVAEEIQQDLEKRRKQAS